MVSCVSGAAYGLGGLGAYLAYNATVISLLLAIVFWTAAFSVPWSPFTLPHVPAKTAERSLQCSQEGVDLQQMRGSVCVAQEVGSRAVDIPKCGGGFHIRLLQGGHESDGRVESKVADRAPTHSQIARNHPAVRSWLWMSCGRVEGWRETAPRLRLARTSCRTERTSSPDLRRVYLHFNTTSFSPLRPNAPFRGVYRCPIVAGTASQSHSAPPRR